MTKRHNAKYKMDRKLSANLWGRAKSPYNTRPTKPGQHGARPRKISDYGQQLLEKQRLKFYYANVGERKFRSYFQEALRMSGDTSENLIGLLERRLDTVVYRMKFAPTMFAARQLVNHKHILVDGKKVNIPSYMVKPGQQIEVVEKSKEMLLIVTSIVSQERELPGYIDVDFQKLQGKFIQVPQFKDVPYPAKITPNAVVEFYSR